MVTAIECIAGGPLALMGLCLIAYLQRAKGRGPGYLVVMYGILVVLLPMSLSILVILGLIDRLLGIRARNPLP